MIFELTWMTQLHQRALGDVNSAVLLYQPALGVVNSASQMDQPALGAVNYKAAQGSTEGYLADCVALENEVKPQAYENQVVLARGTTEHRI